MSLSSVCVVTNALRLKNFKSKIDLKHNKENKDQDKFKEETKMNTKIIKIEGMQCNHCKMSVEKALSAIDGVTKVEVSLENKNAIIESKIEINNNEIKKIIEEEGFTVID